MSCCCRAGGSGKGPSGKLAKVFYLFMVIISTILALVLRAYGSTLFVDFGPFHFGCTGSIAERCFGDQAVYRISFALAVFFLFMLLGSVSTAFHRGFWGLKLALWVVLTAVAFFIPNTFYNVYSDIARVVSIVFLLLMVLLLVDFAYTLQEKVFDRIEARDVAMSEEYETVGLCQNPWKMVYLVICAALLILGFAGVVKMYSFSTANGCGGNVAFLSITLVIGLILTIMSVLEAFGGRGLLCPSVVFVYAVWLVWSAMTSSPDEQCNPYGAETNEAGSIIVGLLVSGLSLAYTSYSAANSAGSLCGGGDCDDDLKSSLITTRDDDEEAGRARSGSDASGSDHGHDSDDDREDTGERKPERKERAWFFHFIMLAASLYMAMLLSNWGGSSTESSTRSVGETSMWIKIASQWVTFALYFWTLVAPKCFPDRDFS